MEIKKSGDFIKNVLVNMPKGWLTTTTHRLDIYDEALAKTQFLENFENLFQENNYERNALANLPTAYDYIRLGHPLSCVLEWGIAHAHNLKPEYVISFDSQIAPVLAILRKNLLEKKATQIVYMDSLPDHFNTDLLKRVYGYQFDLKKVETAKDVIAFNGSTVVISGQDEFLDINLSPSIDFYITAHSQLGSVILVNGIKNEAYISEIQHVRRRETIAMTPANCVAALNLFINDSYVIDDSPTIQTNKTTVEKTIQDITNTKSKVLVASSGLSMQYAIMMGLIQDALEEHPGKDIKFIVPPNCYGGTNDQARRVAACLDHVAVVDLLVDGDNDMVESIDKVLDNIAHDDAVPYIIAEIPTNPRVEVPDLTTLKEVLSRQRRTKEDNPAIDPVFILDQTFCPNIHFLGEEDILSEVRTISYASGSKFPSGGLCTAGYCVGNHKTDSLMDKIEVHLKLCDNEATDLQMAVLAKQLPTMNQRIKKAYQNTREFVDFIHEVLPAAKINFVSEKLAEQGFTPSVFSLDLPTKGRSDEEKETYKRELNLKLIHLMITEIPQESKFCVSYGQLKGCYWTIPATSTQGTTKEGDKDYIVRVSLAPNLDLERHKQVFSQFVKGI